MGDWLDGLAGVGDQIGADIVAFLQYLVGLLVAVFTYLYQLLAAVFDFFYSLAQKIARFFSTLWNDFFKGIFTSLWHAIVRVHNWLESILSPIVKFLQKVRAWVDWYFNTYVKPILNLLSQVRNFLNILRQFGIKWAAELDAWLGKVQADIAGAFLKLQGYINAIIGIVNSLADPLGLFRRPTFVMSMRRIFPSFARGVSGMPLGYFFPSPVKGAGNGLGPPPSNFTPTNPQMNPPPSGYLSGDDGLGNFGGWDGTDPLPDDTMDSMTSLDFFNDDAYPDPVVTDVPGTLAQLQQAAYASVSDSNS
jgi:hypothetical protein